MDSQLWWYTARAGGMVTWALLAAGVLWGLALSSKAFGPRPRPSWMLDLHRFLGGAAVVFTGVHLLSLVLDSYVNFGVLELLVPLASGYRPVAVAWGVIAMYLLAAVEVTSLLRRRLSKRAWRMTHVLSFPLFAIGTVHALTAGTDGGSPTFVAVVAATSTAVAILTVVRVAQAMRPARPRARQPVSPVAS